MLSKFFHAQFRFPAKDDWSEQVRLDLKDLNIPENLEWIRSKSKDSFRRLVKKRAKDYALNGFKILKSGHSKLENL